MIETRTAVVKDIKERRPGLVEVRIEIEGRLGRAVAYEALTGPIKVGDRVVVNTTATTLGLGSGGFDFIMVNLANTDRDLAGKGHIMKMRYTPWQCRVLSVEEEASPYCHLLEETTSLEGKPVLVGTLHSMLAPLCACLAAENRSIAYVMTDAASLPLSWSQTVNQLQQKGLIRGTITIGNAWGGDLEAVNIFSGLLAAQAVWKPDVIIVTMGPGIVGTGTRWGFSGVEQGFILEAVETLKGRPLAVPRISFADSRPRHQGISHHTLTVLQKVCRARATVPLPMLEGDKGTRLHEQIQASGLGERHDLLFRDGSPVFEMMARYQLSTITMGRGPNEDPEFFLALGAAARVAMELLI